jgi:glycosyltransferase involved in cell wall biosynthesis
MLPKADGYMRQRSMAAEKFLHIPNGIDLFEWQTMGQPLPEEHRAAIDRQKSAGRFCVGYAGAHGVANALHVLIDAAEQLKQEPVTFVLVGQGPEKDRLRRIAEERSLRRVLFLPPVPKEAVPALLAELDALYIGLARQSLFRFGVSPNKLFDYMAAARPVVYAVDSGNDPVAECGCGVSCGAENPSGVAAAVLRLMRCTPSERRAMGQRGKDHVVRHHEYGTLARRFLEVLS